MGEHAVNKNTEENKVNSTEVSHLQQQGEKLCTSLINILKGI